MRDVSKKRKTLRAARAEAIVTCAPETIATITERRVPKGDPLEISRAVAAQAAKQTSQWIPYCHPIAIDFVGVEYEFKEDRLRIEVTVKAVDRTGVEVEAMTAASAAALNCYDMLKMIDRTVEIGGVRLIEKTGGKTDFVETFDETPCAAVVVLSDSISAGKNRDESGRLIVERLREESFEAGEPAVIPDDPEKISELLMKLADEEKVDLILTSGGTGLSPRDHTPEAVRAVIDRDAPGLAEAMRAYGLDRTPNAMLSRGVAGVRGATLIVTMPGSIRAASESLDALFPALRHAVKMLHAQGRSH